MSDWNTIATNVPIQGVDVPSELHVKESAELQKAVAKELEQNKKEEENGEAEIENTEIENTEEDDRIGSDNGN